jgi:hypothetical protein
MIQVPMMLSVERGSERFQITGNFRRHQMIGNARVQRLLNFRSQDLIQLLTAVRIQVGPLMNQFPHFADALTLTLVLPP